MRAADRKLWNWLAVSWLTLVSVAVTPLVFGQQSSPDRDVGAVRAAEAPGTAAIRQLRPLALSFEKTSVNSQPKFLARGKRSTLLLTRDDAVLVFSKKLSTGSYQLSGKAKPSAELRMRFAGANPKAAIAGEEQLPGKIYYANANSKGRLSGNETFRRVKYSGIYPGIDAVYYGNDHQLEFDLVIAPHADPKQIRLSLAGAERIGLTKEGEISLQIAGEDVRLKRPAIYQEHAGVRREIAGGYRLSRSEARFELGGYDKNLPLIIDPTISYASYVGGPGNESVRELKVNKFGEVYILADSDSSASLPPHQTIPIEPPQSGFPDCFLTKLSSDGSAALYMIVFEGAHCAAMELGPGANVHLSMGTSVNHLRTLSESDMSLNLLQGAYDFPSAPVQSMRSDSNGNVYLIVQGADYELQKVDSSGQLVGTIQLIAPPLYPGNQIFDTVEGLDIDDTGNAYVIGRAYTDGIITPTPNALQATKPSSNRDDVFLLRVNTQTANAFQIDYASYLGGSGVDIPLGIAFDQESAKVLVTGQSDSLDFPTTPGVLLRQPNGLSTFLVKLDLNSPPASQLIYGTFLSSGSSAANTVTALPGGLAAIAGTASDFGGGVFGSPFPLVGSLYPSRGTGETRPFLSVFSADATALRFSTFLDATAGSFSYVQRIASQGTQSLYAALSTDDGGLGTPGAFQQFNAGGIDVLLQALDVSAITPANSPPVVTLNPPVVDVTITSPSSGAQFPLICGRLFTCDITDPDGDAITDYLWQGSNGFRLAGSGSVPSGFVGLSPGNHAFTLTARDERGALGFGSLTVNVSDKNTFTSTSPQTIILTDDRFIADDYKYKGNEHPATITFDSVNSPGFTWLVGRGDLNPPVPDGLQAGSPPYYYDIHTTAAFDGTPRLCMNIQGMSFARPDQIQLYEIQGAVWTALASDLSGTDICASTALLNSSGGDRMTTVAIFYPQVPETAITKIAGTGFAEGSIDGPGGDPRDDADNSVPPTQSAFSRPTYLAYDSAARLLYVTELGTTSAIRRINLNNNTLSTVLPSGQGLGTGAIALDPTGQFLYYVQKSFGLGDLVWRHDLFNNLPDVVVAGGGPFCDPPASGQSATQACLIDVNALVLDAGGNLFIASGSTILRVDSSGILLAILNENGNGNGDGMKTPFFDIPRALAFDQQGYLLVGGQTLVRVPPSFDGFEVIGGIPPINFTGYATPFAGDGLPATQAALLISYQMIVASDGAVIFTDGITQRIRRIAPGADGVVNGGQDDIVQTIAGFFNSTLPSRSAFATSFYGDFRGIAEDPDTGSIFASTYSGNTVERFGISPAITGRSSSPQADLSITATATPNPVDVGGLVTFDPITVTNNGPAPATGLTLNFPLPASVNFASATTSQGTCSTPSVGSSGTVSCNLGSLASGASAIVSVAVKPQSDGPFNATISVSGAETDPNPVNNSVIVATTVNLAPAVIDVSETITVSDSVNVLPSAMIGVNENITVADGVNVLPSALIGVNETVNVSDAVDIKTNHPPSVIASAPTPVEATSPAGASVTLTGSATDSDAGDTLTLAWTEGTTPLGTTAVVTTTLPLGVHNLTFTATDNQGASAAALVSVTVQDTTPPGIVISSFTQLEGNSPGGFLGTAFEATANDMVDGTLPVVCTPSAGSLFPLGSTLVSCTAADSRHNSRTSTVLVRVADTIAPVVTPPLSITVPATEAGGARASAWPALAAFLTSATATDVVDTAPAQLAALVGSTPVGSNTLFPIGATVVTFRFRDASGNIGSATASVTVVVGNPRIAGQIAAQGRDANGNYFVDLKLTNVGSGNARRLRLLTLLAATTQGRGVTRVISPNLPLTVGTLDVGVSQNVHIVLRVPSTVTRFILIEVGDFTNVKGVPSLFAQTQSVTP